MVSVVDGLTTNFLLDYIYRVQIVMQTCVRVPSVPNYGFVLMSLHYGA